MTVGELINQLSKYDPSTDILVVNKTLETLIINGTKIESDYSDFDRTGEVNKIVYIRVG